MSDHLKAFLAEYLEWINAGAVEGNCFSRHTGLCGNFEDWLVEREFGWREYEPELDSLLDQFKADGLHTCYPFGGEDVYYAALQKDEQHLNNARIDWVRSKVAHLEVA